MSVPDHRLAICRRCRWDSRRASGAATDDVLLEHARAWCESNGVEAHVRLSQCLHSCDGGHTVRVEWRGWEVALVGIRTLAELERVLTELDAIGRGEVPAALLSRVWQVWKDGEMRWHTTLHGGRWPGPEPSEG